MYTPSTQPPYSCVARILLLIAILAYSPAAVAGISTAAESYYIEAECADIGARWYTVSDADASGGTYVVSQFSSPLFSTPADTPLNRVRFNISGVSADKPFTVYARLNAPTKFTDSYYVRVNNGPWATLSKGFAYGTGFHWEELVTAQFREGTNTVDIAYRESNTQLDKLYLSDQPGKPAGLGDNVQTCGDTAPPPADGKTYWLEAECGIVGSSLLTVEDTVASGGAYVRMNGSGFPTRSIDVPSNRLRFVIENPDVSSGPFNIWLLGLPPNPNEKYYIRVNGSPYSYRGLRGRELNGTLWERKLSVNLREGTNYIDITPADGLALDKILVTSYGLRPDHLGGLAADCALTPQPVVSINNSFWLEAECTEVGSNWQVEADRAASGDRYAVVRGLNAVDAPPTDAPENLLRFFIPEADSGSYNLFTRVNAPDGLDDSYYIRINEGEWYAHDYGIQQGAGFIWNQPPTSFTLYNGENTVDITFREDGTQLDKIYLTLTADEPITGSEGGQDSNCIPDDIFFTPERASAHPTLEASLEVYPNPAVNKLTVKLTDAHEGRVFLSITDHLGRGVGSHSREKAGAELRADIDVASLAAGMYYLRILEGGEQTVRTFVKR